MNYLVYSDKDDLDIDKKSVFYLDQKSTFDELLKRIEVIKIKSEDDILEDMVHRSSDIYDSIYFVYFENKIKYKVRYCNYDSFNYLLDKLEILETIDYVRVMGDRHEERLNCKK